MTLIRLMKYVSSAIDLVEMFSGVFRDFDTSNCEILLDRIPQYERFIVTKQSKGLIHFLKLF